MQRYQSTRASALIVALIFAAILAISLTSYLNLSLNASRLANRSFHMNAAQNLVDTGLERTLWSLNNAHLYASPNNWIQGGFAAVSGTEYRGTFPSSGTWYPLSGGAEGQVKVWVTVSNLAAVPAPTPDNYIWHAVAQATIKLGNGSTLSKMAEAYLQQRSYAGGGMVARNGMSFNGAVEMDSWISRPTPGADVPYSTSVRRANATVATPGLINLQNADIYGYVSIGGSTIDNTSLDVGPNGRVRGTFPGTSGIDATRVTCDFTASFPDVHPATTGSTGGPITGNTTFSTGIYTRTYIDMNGGSAGDIHIGPSSSANVTLTITNNVTMGGGPKIIIYPGSTLKMYVGGNITMTGNSGVLNGTSSVPNNPDCFTLLGLRTEAEVVAAGGSAFQVWDIKGNGYLSCVIFAPNGNVSVNGNGNTYGSIVGNRVDMVGTGAFHQDESLANKRTSGLWGLLKWRELYTATDRALYASQFSLF